MSVQLPPLILFFVARRSYIQGIVITGVKGQRSASPQAATPWV